MTTTQDRTALALAGDDREARLPSWARDRLDELRRLVREAERVRDDAVHATSPETSDAVQRTGRMHDTFVGLGAGLRGQVTYLLDGPGRVEVDDRHVDVRVEDGRLYVVGSDGLTVRPSASNSVYVDVAERRRGR